MKRSHGLLAVSGLAAAVVFAGCSDDPAPSKNTGTAGTSTGGTTGGSMAGTSTTAGTETAGTFGTAGTAGTEAGGTGGTAGTGTAGTATAGTGGTVPVIPIVPTVFLIDNIRLQPYVGGEGGAGGAGAGGADAGGADAGGAPTVPVAQAGADAGGAAGAGGADAGPLPDFYMPFDANVTGFSLHSDGFSPNVGGDTAGTPFIFDQTTLTWEAAAGKPGGAAKVSVPFTVKNQQADIGGTFAVPSDLTGYELTADVKMTGTGDVGDCATVWLYVYGGNGYANDKSGEPSQGVTSHLVKDEWKTVRLRLDGPYGYHSTANHPNFKPTLVNVWGAQFVTFGCP
jgi:hypothetical protein